MRFQDYRRGPSGWIILMDIGLAALFVLLLAVWAGDFIPRLFSSPNALLSRLLIGLLLGILLFSSMTVTRKHKR